MIEEIRVNIYLNTDEQWETTDENYDGQTLGQIVDHYAGLSKINGFIYLVMDNKGKVYLCCGGCSWIRAECQ